MVDAWVLEREEVTDRRTEFTGPDWSDGADTEPVAVVTYSIRGEWLLDVERRVLAPTGGPTALHIEPLVGSGETPLGGLDSWGITQADLRAVPIRDARERLERLTAEHRAAGLIAALPDEYKTDWQYAKLADAVVALAGWQIRNPAGMIAKQKSTDRHNTWATRVKRARQRGLLADGPALTAKARALVAD